MEPIKYRSHGWAAALMIALTIAFVLWAYWVSAKPADAAPGDIEVRAYVPLAPDPALTIGGGLAVEVCEIAPEWPFVGPLFGGRGLFADVLYLSGSAVLGVSGSVRPMAEDDGLRVFCAAWWAGDAQWTCGLSQVVGSW